MDVVKELFDTEDLYEVLAVSKDGANDEKTLRSAYLKAALKFHPDKAPAEDRESYTKKFQLVKKIYEIFQDKDLKKIYDDTGSWPEDESVEFDVESFARLDANAIEEFKKMYQGSDEERQDIKKYYLAGQGDICHICDNVFFLNILDDEDRVNEIIEGLIEDGEIERLTKGKKGAKAIDRKKKKAAKEAEEAEQMKKEKNLGGSLSDLEKAIAKNRSSRGSFLDSLAAKYGGGDAPPTSKRNGKKADLEEDGPTNKKPKTSKSTAGRSGSAAGGGRTTRSRSAK